MLELFGDPTDPDDTRIIPPQPDERPQPKPAHSHHNSQTNALQPAAASMLMQPSAQQNAAVSVPAANHSVNGNGVAHGWKSVATAEPGFTDVALEPDVLRAAQAAQIAPSKPAPAPAASTASKVDPDDEEVEEEDDSTEESSGTNNLGIRIVFLSSAILAILICISGAYTLAQDPGALQNTKNQCDQLYVWSMLFVMFEGIYLIFLTLHAFRCNEANLHAKRAKTSFLLIVLLMSVMMFLWGTIIINRCTCPEDEHKTMWTFFRVLYWMVIGIWSLVLCALTAPVGLFLAFKIWADRNG